MKVVYFLIALILPSTLLAQDLVLTAEGKYKLRSNIHLIHDIAYKKKTYRALIEVPAGYTEKWEVSHLSGHLEWTLKKGQPRKISFLAYPGNYGFIPQTTQSKSTGGDGSPLDVIVLGPSVDMGAIQNIRIIGALKLLDKGVRDDKIIAVPLNGPFNHIYSISEMMIKFPGVIEITRTWFEGYKGSKVQFIGYRKRKKSKALVEQSHTRWARENAH